MATVKTQTGRAITANRMKGTTPSQAEPLYIGIGTGAGTAAATDTSLFTEAGTTRLTGTSSIVTTTTTNDTYRVTATYTATGSISVTNAGTFDNATVGSGSLDVKGDFTAAALASGDSLVLTIDQKFA